jgi:hypothetical protein
MLNEGTPTEHLGMSTHVGPTEHGNEYVTP